MYAGSIVEEADVETLFCNPLHAYTRALLDAVPGLTGAGLPRPIAGMVPDCTAAPPGCRFHPRCAFAEPSRQQQPLVDLGSGHRVACVLPAKDQAAPRIEAHA